MRFEELGAIRSAMYGYDFAGSQKPGWFKHLFQDYSLHPYLNILSEDTRDLLALVAPGVRWVNGALGLLVRPKATGGYGYCDVGVFVGPVPQGGESANIGEV